MIIQNEKCANGEKTPLDEECALGDMNKQVESGLKVTQDVDVVTDLGELKELYGGKMPISGESQANNYNMHPTYSFRGLHENFVVGLLGQIDVRVPAYMTKYNLLKGFRAVQNKYQAYAIKFKYPSEHKIDGRQYSMELQVMMTQISGNAETENRKNLQKVIGQQVGYAYKQFGLGYVDTEGTEAEKSISEMTDMILSISIDVNMTMTRPNMFVHFLSNEDWYEAQEIQLEE